MTTSGSEGYTRQQQGLQRVKAVFDKKGGAGSDTETKQGLMGQHGSCERKARRPRHIKNGGSGNSRCKDLCGRKMFKDNPEHPVARGEVAETSGNQVTGAVRSGDETGFYRGAMRSPRSISGEEITFWEAAQQRGQGTGSRAVSLGLTLAFPSANLMDCSVLWFPHL